MVKTDADPIELLNSPLYVDGVAYERDKIVAFDIETTGLDFSSDEILQFSAVDGYGNVLIDEYFKPERITDWSAAEAVNGISPEMVADKPHFSQAAGRIQEIFDNAALIVGYNNIEFDEKFCKAAGIKMKESTPRFDVMREFAPIAAEWSDKRNDFKWKKLTDCAAFYGYEFEAHNSLEDILATLHCFEQMASSPFFYLNGNEQCPEVMLFTTKEEAVSRLKLDILSGVDTRGVHMLVIGEEIEFDRLNSFLEKHPNISEIVCCMDSADTQDEYTNRLLVHLGSKYSISVEIPHEGSWTAELESVLSPENTPAQTMVSERVLEFEL